MKTLITLIASLALTGCVSGALPAWWTAHRLYVIEAGVAAGAATQIEAFAVETKTVVKDFGPEKK